MTKTRFKMGPSHRGQMAYEGITADEIRALRLARKMTLTDFAKFMGINYNSMWRWENNEARPSGQGKIKLELLKGGKYVKHNN